MIQAILKPAATITKTTCAVLLLCHQSNLLIKQASVATDS
jgi:hypothetical protein